MNQPEPNRYVETSENARNAIKFVDKEAEDENASSNDKPKPDKSVDLTL